MRPTLRPKTLTRRLSFWLVAAGLPMLGLLDGVAASSRDDRGARDLHAAHAAPRFRARPVASDAALTVCPAGCAYATIQSALDAAKPGDGIFVGNGVYPEVLTVKTSVSIRGVDPSVTVIDGGQAGPVISIQQGVGATISGFKITGGRAAGGAGIYNQGALFLSDAVVEGNETTDPATGFGGGIFNYGGSITLSDVTIKGNKAELGGGLLNAYGIASLVRTTVEGNAAAQFGGGIFNGATARLNVDTLLLKDNDVGTGRGGGLYSAGFSYVQRSTFTGNSSGENGGAVYQFGDVTILSNSTLSGNRADFGGSAVYVNSGAMLITNVTFANNSGGFGALFSLAPAETEFDRVRLRNTLMADNAGGSCFGTIVSEGHNIDSGNSCSFSGEKDRVNIDPRIQPLADNGGMLATHDLRADSPAIDGGDPAGCSAPDDTLLTTDQRGRIRPVDGSRDGQAVCEVGSVEYWAYLLAPTPVPPTPVTLPGAAQVCPSGCPFTTIQAAIDAAAPGGSIAVKAGTYKERLKISKNLTLAGAGSVYSVVDADSQGPVLEVSAGAQVTVRSLTLTRGAGISNLGDLTLERVLVSYHSGPEAGGVLNRGRLVVRNADFVSNVSLSRGGAIHNDGGSLEVDGSRLRENTSAVDGGAIYAKGGTVALRNSVLLGNLGRYGGAINLRESVVTVDDTQFTGNRADLGGAVFSYGGSVTFNRGTMERNRADVGGAVYLYATDTVPGRSLKLSGTRLTENTAAGTYGFGGAITNNGGDLTMTQVTLADNVARNGGALYAYQPASTVVGEQLIVERNGAARGAGLFVDGGRLTLSRSQFTQNAATLDGGGLHLARSLVALTDVNLTSNSAARDGGGMLVGPAVDARQPVQASGLVLTGNGAERQGGAIAVADLGRLMLDGAAFSENEANGSEGQGGYGGAVVVLDGAEATLRRGILRNNVARLGGAIAISGTLLLENSTLTANQALRGAAVFSVGQGRMVSSTVARNLVSTVEGETGGAAGVELDRGATLITANSIIALGEGGADCQGALNSLGYNLSGDSSCGINGTGDQRDVDPGLLALADNGGSTLSMDLLPGSSAVDGGDPAGCKDLSGNAVLAVDQRGAKRPVDGNGDGTVRCDIGAVEHGPMALPSATPSSKRRIFLPLLRKNE